MPYPKGDVAHVEKDYPLPYALEKEKLTRIVSILQEEGTGTDVVEPEFTVELKDRRIITPSSLEELFKLDNTVRNPITALRVTHDHSRALTHLSYDVSVFSNISLEVISHDQRIANAKFAELEEQVERTLLSGWVYRLVKRSGVFGYVPILVFLLVIVSASFLFLQSKLTDITSNRNAQLTGDTAVLLQKAQSASSTEEKINFLFEVQRAELVHQQEIQTSKQSAASFSQYANVTTLLIALPWLIAFGCTIYNLWRCYPRNVFIWGDYGEEYQTLLSRRKSLWNVVIGVILLGIITNVSVTAMAKYLP